VRVYQTKNGQAVRSGARFGCSLFRVVVRQIAGASGEVSDSKLASSLVRWVFASFFALLGSVVLVVLVFFFGCFFLLLKAAFHKTIAVIKQFCKL
jgi:hypothetical protein